MNKTFVNDNHQFNNGTAINKSRRSISQLSYRTGDDKFMYSSTALISSATKTGNFLNTSQKQDQITTLNSSVMNQNFTNNREVSSIKKPFKEGGLNQLSVFAGDGNALNVSNFSLPSGSNQMESQIKGGAFADHQTREQESRERERRQLEEIKLAQEQRQQTYRKYQMRMSQIASQSGVQDSKKRILNQSQNTNGKIQADFKRPNTTQRGWRDAEVMRDSSVMYGSTAEAQINVQGQGEEESVNLSQFEDQANLGVQAQRRRVMNKSQVNFRGQNQMLAPLDRSSTKIEEAEQDQDYFVESYQNFLNINPNRVSMTRNETLRKKNSLLQKLQNSTSKQDGSSFFQNNPSLNQQFTKSQTNLSQMMNHSQAKPLIENQPQYPKTSIGGMLQGQATIKAKDPSSKKEITTEDMRQAFKESQKYNSRFVEQWINDTLQECHHLGIPGVIARPEHKLPVSRHGLDRITLTNMGMPNDMVNRIYRSLFVFTVGFYELMSESTKYLSELRIETQSKIWKVFQILLEYCLEKSHHEEYEEMEAKYRETIRKLEVSEQELKSELRKLVAKVDDLIQEKGNQDQEKNRMLQETRKYQQKHEEEVQLRLFFESKLNSLHHINREMTKKFQNTKLKLADEQIKIKDFELKVQELMNENTRLKTNSESLFTQVENLKFSKDTVDLDKNDLILKLQDLSATNTETKMTLAFLREQYDALMRQKNSAEMQLSALQDFVDTKSSEQTNIQSYLEQLSLRHQEYETEVQQMKLKEERLRNKLKFYKAQYTGFELTKKSFLEEQQVLRNQVRALKDSERKAKDELIASESKVSSLEKRVQQLLAENEEVADKFRLTTAVRHDLEQQLKQQIDQTKKMMADRDLETKSMFQMKRDMTIREFRLKDLEDEKNELEQALSKVENELEQLRIKYESSQMTLKCQVENEKDSRDNMKEKYEKEAANASYLNKQVIQFKNENLEFRNKISKYDILIQSLKDEKEALKTQRDEFNSKILEFQSAAERFDRELYIKNSLLGDFEAKKKQEINSLKQIIQKQKVDLNRALMVQEDLSSDLLRETQRKRQLRVEIEKQKDLIQNKEEKINLQKQNFNEILKEKLLAQKSFEEKQAETETIKLENHELVSKVEKLNNQIKSQSILMKQLQHQVSSMESQIEEQMQQLSDISLERDNFVNQIGRAVRIDRAVDLDKGAELQYFTQDAEVQVNIAANGRRRSIYQSKGSESIGGSGTNIGVKSNLQGSPGKQNNENENSYASMNQSQKKLKPVFQHGNGLQKNNISTNQSRPFTSDKIEEELQDDYRLQSMQRLRSQSKDNNNTIDSNKGSSQRRVEAATGLKALSSAGISSSAAHHRLKSNDHTISKVARRDNKSAISSRNQNNGGAGTSSYDMMKYKTSQTQIDEAVDVYTENSADRGRDSENFAGSRGQQRQQHEIKEITVRINGETHQHASKTFNEKHAMHEKKLSVDNSNQPRIKRLLKNAYSQRN